MTNRFVKYTVFALALAGFSGCSKRNTGAVVENEKEIHIRVWESKNGIDDFIKQAGKAYTEKNPHVIVDFINVELHNTVDTLAADSPGGVAADIIAAPHDNLGALVTKKLILPTENPQEVTKQVLGACSKALTYNGTMLFSITKALSVKTKFQRHGKNLLAGLRNLMPITLDIMVL